METDRYIVNQRLDAPIRVLGMTLDEGIPAILAFIAFFLVGKIYIGVGVAVVWLALIKRLKKGQGQHFFFALLYWHAAKPLMRYALKKTPAAEKRLWLK